MEFRVTKEYEAFIDISNSRKISLFEDHNNTLTYRQLRRRLTKLGLKFILHHYLPRYRCKKISKKEFDKGSNVLILTENEHVIAHYHLMLSEDGVFKNSAQAAFLQMTSLHKSLLATISSEDIQDIANVVLKTKEEYRNSPLCQEANKRFKDRSSKMMKEKWKDPEFKERMLSVMHSPETREKISKARIQANKLIPPWKMSYPYVPQKWEYLDTIFKGVVHYGLSYKTLGRILNIPYKRISNIVRIIKEDYKEEKTFEDFKFKDQFYVDYESTLHKYEELLNYYSAQTIVPWTKSKGNYLPWLAFPQYYECYVKARLDGLFPSLSSFTNFYGKITFLLKNVMSECDRLYQEGILFAEDIEWMKHWRLLRDLQKDEFLVIQKRILDGYANLNTKAITKSGLSDVRYYTTKEGIEKYAN